LQAQTVPQADSMLSEFPAPPPKGQRRRGRLSLVTFFGETKKGRSTASTAAGPHPACVHEEVTVVCRERRNRGHIERSLDASTPPTPGATLHSPIPFPINIHHLPILTRHNPQVLLEESGEVALRTKTETPGNAA
jgi:hypothetical protein